MRTRAFRFPYWCSRSLKVRTAHHPRIINTPPIMILWPHYRLFDSVPFLRSSQSHIYTTFLAFSTTTKSESNVSKKKKRVKLELLHYVKLKLVVAYSVTCSIKGCLTLIWLNNSCDLPDLDVFFFKSMVVMGYTLNCRTFWWWFMTGSI